MFRLLLRAVPLAFLAIVLASCGTRPRQVVDPTRMFEIGAVGVTANGGVSSGITSGIKDQIDLAIEATVYPVPKPRAVMNIHVGSVTRERGAGLGRAQAEISVALTDVASAQTVLVRNYLVLASSERGRVSDAAIIGAVAARLRFEYALTTPAIRAVPRHDPALSTRLKSSTEPTTAEPKLVVIPLKTAPALGANQDPLLNSKTKIEPKMEPAKVEPSIKVQEKKPAAVVPAENALETGAKAKVVIKPKAAVETAPADDEPCVETLEKKC